MATTTEEDVDLSKAVEESIDSFRQQQKPRAHYVCDVGLADSATVVTGSTHTKGWRIQNPGPVDWPEGCMLVSVGGDLLGGPALGIPLPVAVAGSEIEVTFDLVAPSTPGRYVGYWRSVTPAGVRFGHRIWVDVVVVSGDSEFGQALSLSQAEVAAELAAVEQEPEQEQVQTALGEAAMASAPPLIPAVLPTDVQLGGVAEDPPVGRWMEQLATLRLMGFEGPEYVALLDEYNGDLQQAVQTLF